MLLTARDEDILCTLAHSVRLLTLGQIAAVWWNGTKKPEMTARRRLSQIEKQGLIAKDHVLARPFLSLERPVLSWKPGDSDPDFEALAYHLRERWRGLTYESVLVFFATQAAVNRFGGYMSGILDHPHEATHDLHHAELYVRLKRDHPKLVSGWVSEAQLAKKAEPFEVLPDAVLNDPTGAARLIIEFAGIYDARRLRRIHDYAANREVPYELW